MTLLDAYALIAFLAGERAATQVSELIRSGDCALTSVQLAETEDVLARVLGHDREAVQRAIDPLLVSDIELVDIGAPEARVGAELRGRHYRKRTSELSLADCLLLGAATTRGAGLATSDSPLATAARHEGVPVVALPSTSGMMP